MGAQARMSRARVSRTS